MTTPHYLRARAARRLYRARRAGALQCLRIARHHARLGGDFPGSCAAFLPVWRAELAAIRADFRRLPVIGADDKIPAALRPAEAVDHVTG